AAHPTVEPTLPLAIEMRLEAIESGPSESRARLVVVLTAAGALNDVDLTLPVPAGGAHLDTLELPVRPLALAAGESKTFSIPVRGPARRNLAFRLEASYRTAEGKLL